ncbi:MAG TPA: polysaccharide biosynthesis tyrosine autokinase [Terriglobia bacterium]|nr:polysaccharide biosynthesis tyrosine autokinase [Terriglobia bacterium]
MTLDIESQTLGAYSYLRDYWNTLRKRRWTILTVAFVLVTLAAIYSFKVRPTFRATGRVEVEPDAPPFQSSDQNNSPSTVDASFLQTQVDVLTSDHLAWETIEELKLDANPDFNPDLPPSGRQPPGDISSLQSRLIHVFHDHLHVALARDSRMLEVSFDSTDPRLGASVANALMNNYIQYNFMTKYDATRQASGWMEQQLDELKAKVETSQQALVDYERQNAIVDVGDKQSLAARNLAALGQEFTEARNHLAEEQSLYDLVKSNPSQTALLAQDDLLQMLEEKFADLKTNYVNTLAQYGPKFPKVVRLKDQINTVESLIAEERRRSVDRIRRNYDAATGREEILAREVAQAKIEMENLNQLLIQHNILKHDFETNQDLYDSLLKRLKDATVEAGLRATNIHIVDRALPPTLPVRPRKALNIAVGMMLGLILGVTLALVEEGFDTSMMNAEDVERLLPTPNLAVIPAAFSLKQRSFRAGKHDPRRAGHDHVVALAVSRRPHSALAESFRSLRTLILLSSAPRPPQALLVTSAQSGEGKTSASVNLALALAQRGGRVLLMDGDLRKPEIANTLGLTGTKGLSGILTGAHGFDASVESSGLSPNLWALHAGQYPPNPSELLSSSTMEQLLAGLRRRFDYLVIDSPPVLPVTDATVLSKFVDGVVLVVESGVTPSGALLRAYKTLESAGARILGTVLNKMDLRYDGYYRSVYKTYHRYYYRDQEPTHTTSSQTSAAMPKTNSLPQN